jgi:hypothetical protein
MINDKFPPRIIIFNDYFKKRSNIIRILLITFIISFRAAANIFYFLFFIFYFLFHPFVYQPNVR